MPNHIASGRSAARIKTGSSAISVRLDDLPKPVQKCHKCGSIFLQTGSHIVRNAIPRIKQWADNRHDALRLGEPQAIAHRKFFRSCHERHNGSSKETKYETNINRYDPAKTERDCR
jgi:hypothetical protein